VDKAIALVGARGAGKSAVGAELARLLGASFRDVDDEVVPGEPAGAALARLGEAGFRALELAALRRVLAEAPADGAPLVVATGGGVVETPEARELLRARARVVWLSAPAEVLARRIAADPTPRPALQGRDASGEIEAVLRRREPWYRELADAIVASGDADVATVARRVATALGLQLDA